MAPRKKAEETKTMPSEKRATRSSARMTRSSAKRLNAKLTELPTESGKKRKQEKAAESKKKKVKTEVKEEVETKTVSSSEAQVEGNTEEVKEEEEPEADEDEDEAKEDDAKEESHTFDAVTKTIVIEHCKQCNAFKTRAMQVKDGLLSAFPGISVLLNPEKPRRGCFEIREEGGENFISLQNMKRPFPPLKALDMDHVISDIIDRVKSSTNASG